MPVWSPKATLLLAIGDGTCQRTVEETEPFANARRTLNALLAHAVQVEEALDAADAGAVKEACWAIADDGKEIAYFAAGGK